MHYNSTNNYIPLNSKIKVDLLLISNSPYLNLKLLCNTITPAVVVIDGSNSMGKTELWKKQCEELHLRCHSTTQMGAFIMNVE